MQGPDDAKNQTKRRLARSHSMKEALEHKRKLLQESGDNFFMTTTYDKPRRLAKKTSHVTRPVVSLVPSLVSLSAASLDPFQTLAVDSNRLQTLLSNCMSPGPADKQFRQAYLLYQIMPGRLLSQYSAFQSSSRFKISARFSELGSLTQLSLMPLCSRLHWQ